MKTLIAGFFGLALLIQLSTAYRRAMMCGKRHLDAPGILTSPHYPRTYPSTTDCQWIISTTERKIITLQFSVFSFENHRDCEYDYLDIYDGNSFHARRLGRFCGNQLPGKLVSSGSKMFIVFHSDSGVEERGFSLSYSASYGCDRVLTANSGEIISPNFPEHHPQPTQCNYRINVTSGSTIRLTFESFNLEDPSVNGCEYDYIEIFDGPTDRSLKLGKFCGQVKPSIRPSTGHHMLIKFVADATVTRAGFRIKYYAKGISTGDICNRPKYTGDCRAGFNRWFYNSITRNCETFIYGGCNSNGNNFETEAECARQCQGRGSGDVNECSQRNGGCDQACHNTLGSYFCSCWKGYKIAADQRTCEDEDECSLGRNVHHCEHNCTNVLGSYYCTCSRGFQLSANQRTCNDIDECVVGGQTLCHQECINLPGNYRCSCYEGYEPYPGRSKRCRDINECELDLPDCHACTNLDGSYQCECNRGFTLSEDKKSCSDIDECLVNNGGCSQLCINEPGSYKCQCKKGFSPTDSASINCEDINECSGNNGKGNCSYQCSNSIGSFNCSCPDGYVLGDNQLTCFDIDECLINNAGCTQKCVNVPASYECACHDGYKEIGKRNTDVLCRDIDECADGSHKCDTELNATCVNEIGNYSCLCPSGYFSDWNKCVDMNECLNMSINSCHHLCVNTPGSFHCTCLEGFSLIQDNNTCIDIDECAESPCSHNCLNFIGSFICLCNDGFHLHNDSRTCLDINECEIANGVCDQICINTNGSRKCECHDGYRLLNNGRTCVDVDECAEETACCDSICNNHNGGYSCSCDEGHFLSRDNCTCQDTNECLVNNGGCEHNCNNTKGGFSCSCRPGYQKDSSNSSRCIDIDECALENGGCAQICNNSEGSYECHCRPIFKLAADGKTCDHCPTCETFESVINIIEELQLEVKTLQGKVSQLSGPKVSNECLYKETVYKNRDNWSDGDCRSCYCQDGQVICFQDKDCFQADSPARKTPLSP